VFKVKALINSLQGDKFTLRGDLKFEKPRNSVAREEASKMLCGQFYFPAMGVSHQYFVDLALVKGQELLIT